MVQSPMLVRVSEFAVKPARSVTDGEGGPLRLGVHAANDADAAVARSTPLIRGPWCVMPRFCWCIDIITI